MTTFGGLSEETLAADAVQFVARRLDEVTPLRAARRAEEVLGFSAPAPDSP